MRVPAVHPHPDPRSLCDAIGFDPVLARADPAGADAAAADAGGARP